MRKRWLKFLIWFYRIRNSIVYHTFNFFLKKSPRLLFITIIIKDTLGQIISIPFLIILDFIYSVAETLYSQWSMIINAYKILLKEFPEAQEKVLKSLIAKWAKKHAYVYSKSCLKKAARSMIKRKKWRKSHG